MHAGTGPALYAFTLGLVAALNPCGFPLLPAYLSLFAHEGNSGGWTRRTARGLLTGASVSLGFVVVFGAFGIAVESGVQALSSWVPWVMIPLGAALVAVGILTASGRPMYLRLPSFGIGERKGIAAMVTFGVGYAVASLTCALPLFLAGVAGAFTRLGTLVGIVTAIAYALGMGLFMMVASLIVAWAGGPAIRRFGSISRFIPRFAGIVLSAVGAYLIYYWANYLSNPLSSPTPVRAVERIQSALSNWLSASPQFVGLALAAVVLVALGLLAFNSKSDGPGTKAPNVKINESQANIQTDISTQRELQHDS